MDFTIENKISKIYTQNSSSKNQTIFINELEAKLFFLTGQAIRTYDQYCYQQEWKLTNDGKSLWWTITFKLYHDISDHDYVPDSTKWRYQKAQLTDKDLWFRRPNHPIISHDVDHIF